MKKAAVVLFVLLAVMAIELNSARGADSPAISKVTIMSPTFKAQTASIGMYKDDPKMSANVERLLKTLIEEQFKNLGYTIAPIDLSAQALAQDSDMQTSYRQLISKYEAYRGSIKKFLTKPIMGGNFITKSNLAMGIDEKKWSENGPYNLGETVAAFCEMAGTDALVFTTGDGKFAAGGDDNGGVLHITVVAKDGTVTKELSVSFCFPVMSSKDEDVSKSIKSDLDKAFKSFPKPAK